MLSKWNAPKLPNGGPRLPMHFSAGEILIEDDPYACVLDTCLLSVACSYCMGKGFTTYCTQCGWLTYCSKQCKKKDRIYHNLECKVLQGCDNDDELPNQEGRLLIRVIDRCLRERREGRESVGDYFGCRRTINDLIGHLDKLTDAERRQAEHRAQFIYDLVKPHLDVTFSEVLNLLQRCRINCHSLVDHNSPQNYTCGRAVYLGVSKMNHSCGPIDYIQIFDGRRYLLRALRDIEVADPFSLTIRYIPPALPLAARQKRLLNSYFFICNCTKCLRQSRNPEPKTIDPTLVTRIEQAFGEVRDYKTWLTVGPDLLSELEGEPDSNFYMYWLLTQMQFVCAKCCRFEDSIEYGVRAISVVETVLSLEIILYNICQSMVRLGWNKRYNENYQIFGNTINILKDLYLVTHGEGHKILRSLNAMKKGTTWWRILKYRSASKQRTDSSTRDYENTIPYFSSVPGRTLWGLKGEVQRITSAHY